MRLFKTNKGFGDVFQFELRVGKQTTIPESSSLRLLFSSVCPKTCSVIMALVHVRPLLIFFISRGRLLQRFCSQYKESN